MVDQVPEFTSKEITSIAQDLYGIKGDISPLVSFEDQNARIKTQDQSYVLKIGNKKTDIENLHMQTEALKYISEKLPNLDIPKIIPTINEKTVTLINGFPVRLLTYIEGRLLGDVPRSKDLYYNLGQFVGSFTKAMAGFSHPATHKPDDLWLLGTVLKCKPYIEDVADEELKARVGRFYQNYETRIVPKIPSLRTAVLHNDMNEQNILVSQSGPPKITGLLDFGDLGVGPIINELAVTLAYALLGEDNFKGASNQIIEGYIHEFPLFKEELDILFDMVAMRLVQSIVMTSHRAKLYPENKYILVSQEHARALLKYLEKNKPKYTG